MPSIGTCRIRTTTLAIDFGYDKMKRSAHGYPFSPVSDTRIRGYEDMWIRAEENLSLNMEGKMYLRSR